MLTAAAVGGLGWLMSGGRGGVRERVAETLHMQPTPIAGSMETMRRAEDASWTGHAQSDHGRDSNWNHGSWGGLSDQGSCSSSSSSSSSSI
jgi:hypothetical protein